MIGYSHIVSGSGFWIPGLVNGFEHLTVGDP